MVLWFSSFLQNYMCMLKSVDSDSAAFSKQEDQSQKFLFFLAFDLTLVRVRLWIDSSRHKFRLFGGHRLRHKSDVLNLCYTSFACSTWKLWYWNVLMITLCMWSNILAEKSVEFHQCVTCSKLCHLLNYCISFELSSSPL